MSASAYTYFNELDPFPASWLSRLYPDSIVDQRSITDVAPAELVGYRRAHFFAGIGGWQYALELAGWPADREVWTGSCPCQPFSGAGRRKGFDDSRHLWPEWFRLISERRPATIFGEQVASKDGLGWLDLVLSDLESLGYACGAADLPACSVGAPHKRNRLWFVADAVQARRPERRPSSGFGQASSSRRPELLALSDLERREGLGISVQLGGPRPPGAEASWSGEAVGLDIPAGPGPLPGTQARIPREEADRAQQRGRDGRGPTGSGTVDFLGHSSSEGSRRHTGAVFVPQALGPESRFGARRIPDELVTPGATSGAWAGAEWWLCRDGKARAAQPGTFPLAHGVPGRARRLAAFGNAIVPQVAALFIGAFLEAEEANQ